VAGDIDLQPSLRQVVDERIAALAIIINFYAVVNIFLGADTGRQAAIYRVRREGYLPAVDELFVNININVIASRQDVALAGGKITQRILIYSVKKAGIITFGTLSGGGDGHQEGAKQIA
jgi:hypothetical protein